MRRLIVPLVVLIPSLMLVAAPRGALAFRLSGGGASLGFTNPEDLDGTLDVGGHVEFEQAGTRVHLIPGVRFWNVNGTSDLNVNGDLYYHLNPEGVATPYLGAGLGLHMMNNDRTDESSTSLGPNLFGGVRFPARTAHTFVEARLALAEVSQFAVRGGMTWHRW